MKKVVFIICFYLFLSILLSFIWFHKGLLIALGESAIPFYNPNYVLQFYGQSWTPISMGYFPGTTITSIPFFTFAAFLFNLHIPGYLVEAIFFALIVFLAMVGGFFCFSLLVYTKNKMNYFIGVFSGLFYFFNQIFLVIGFNRVEFPFTMFYLSLPFALLFFIQGIKKRQMRYVLFFNISLLPFVSAFGSLPFIELLWFLLFLYVIFTILVSYKKSKEAIFPLVFFISCIVVWILCSMWWIPIIIQYALFTPHPAYNVKGDIGTFTILSEDQGNLSYIFRLMNQHFLQSMIPPWGKLFFSPLLIVLSYLVPFLAFLPLFFKKKPVIIYFFLGIALIGIFLSKGSAGPYGQLFLFLFSYSTVLQVFRNSFEKIGLLLPIAYTPLIGYSLWIIFSWLKKRYTWIVMYGLISFVTVAFCGILVYPFWSTAVFTYNLPPENNASIGDYVQVPDFYNKANVYLAKDPSDARILALPMGGEGITTTWPHPYNGVEYTNGLLGRSAISYTTIMPYLDLVTTQLNTTFLTEPQYIEPIMQLLDAKYLMIRSDIDYASRQMPNPSIFNMLAKQKGLPGLTLSKKFGGLQFFVTNKQPEKAYVGKSIYAADKAISFADIFALSQFGSHDVILNTGESKQADVFSQQHSQTTFLQPKYSIDYSSYPQVSLNTAETMVPVFYRFLPSSPFYLYEQIKEKWERMLQVDEEDKMFYDMDTLSQRVGELQKVILDRDRKNIPLTIKNYEKQLNLIQSRSVEEYPAEIIRNINNFRYRVIGQETILQNLVRTVPDRDIHTQLLILWSKLKKFAVVTHAESFFHNDQYIQEQTKQIVYQFYVQNADTYNFYIKQDSFPMYYENQVTWQLTINDKQELIQPKDENEWFDFGKLLLKKGWNEVAIPTPNGKNLIQVDTEDPITLIGSLQTKEQKYSVPINPFDANAPYKITFDYKLNVSGGARIEAISEFDTVQNGKFIPEWSTDLGKTVGSDWQTTSSIVYPYSTASKQSITFVADPVNNCLRQNQGNAFALDRCAKDKKFHDRYDEKTDLEIKNIRVERVFSNDILLKQNNSHTRATNSQSPSLTYQRVDASNYFVTVRNARKPFLLVFSETYYPAWKAIFTDTGKTISESNHFLVNTYANAWYVARTGNFTIHIQFSHENLFTTGKGIAIPIILIIIGISIVLIIKKK